jgi:hypothetical protein
MTWMLQPHSYTQIIRPNLYNVAYRRVGAYKGMGGLGQGCTDPTNPACVNPAGTDIYQLTGPGGQLLPVSQYVGSTNPPTNWMPILFVGAGLLVIMAVMRR